MIKEPNEKKITFDNFSEIIDGEVYAIEMNVNKDDDNSQNATKTSNDFASAMLEFVHGCDRILKHSEGLQSENGRILINSENMMTRIKRTAYENQEILKLIKLNTEQKHALLQCIVDENGRIEQLHKDMTDISGVAKTNQQALLKRLQADK